MIRLSAAISLHLESDIAIRRMTRIVHTQREDWDSFGEVASTVPSTFSFDYSLSFSRAESPVLAIHGNVAEVTRWLE